MENNKIPLGFGFALAQDPTAMEKFASLSKSEQEQLIQKAHQASSKGEMQSLVNSLSSSKSSFS